MTAIVTDSLKVQLANLLYSNIADTTDSDVFYIGIGKSDEYNAADTIIDPARSIREERNARANLQSVKKVNDTSFVIPRYNWTNGTLYSGFNDTTVGIPTNSYYVITEDNGVYLCVQQGTDALGRPVASTVKPDYVTAGVSEAQIFETVDGYRWKFLYSLSASRANAFLSANWVPTQSVDWEQPGDSAGKTTFELQQVAVKRNAVPGQILGVTLVSGGSGYTSTPTVNIIGNGQFASATATISGGSVVRIQMDNESAALGQGYEYANIEITGGGGAGATARPIIGPVAGLGADILQDLKATSIMLNIKPDGTEGGEFVADNDFRQITVYKNIRERSSGDILTQTSARALRAITVGDTSSFTVEDPDADTTYKLIRGSISNAAAFIDTIDSDVIYYHQNENTGFGVFQIGEIIAESGGDGTDTITGITTTSLADGFSGDLLYIENRARVIRDPAQTEDIKVIISV